MNNRQTETLRPGSGKKADDEISLETLIEFGLKPIAGEEWLKLRAFARQLTPDEKEQFLNQLTTAVEIVQEEIEMVALEKEIGVLLSGGNIYNFQAEENNQR